MLSNRNLVVFAIALAIPALLRAQPSLDSDSDVKLPAFFGRFEMGPTEFSLALRELPDQVALRTALLRAVERCLETNCQDRRIVSVLVALAELREERAIALLWKIVADDDRFAEEKPDGRSAFNLGIINLAARAIAQIDPQGQHPKLMARLSNAPLGSAVPESIIRGLATSADPGILSKLEQLVAGEPHPRERRRLNDILEPMRVRVRAAQRNR